RRLKLWYTPGMKEGNTMPDTVKAAISLRKSLFEQVDETARKLKISRSRLISTAIEDYLYRRESKEIQDSWNAAYENGLTDEDRDLLDHMNALFEEVLDDEEW